MEYDGVCCYCLWYRARYYNPAIGRFISEDPLGFAGGINEYTYALDSPLNFVDPSGLDVTIALYTNGANGQGHVGVGVNTNNTYGYYPDYKAWCILAGCGMPGSLDRDATRSAGEGPVQYLTIPTTPAQDQAMQAAINQWNNNKGEWSLYGRNCARYAENVLNAGGIPNVPNDVIPKNLFHDLQQMYPDPLQQIIYRGTSSRARRQQPRGQDRGSAKNKSECSHVCRRGQGGRGQGR